MTPATLIAHALKMSGVLGIGQSAAYEDTNDLFFLLNGLLAQWSRKRYLVYHLIDRGVVSTGAQSYTVGPGQQIDIPRPDRLQAAYCRLLPVTDQPVDWPLDILESYEDYSAISLKKVQSFPVAVFYDSGFPHGAIFPLPVPTANNYEIHVVVKETLPQFPDLTTEIILPPEYTLALLYNLAVLARPHYQLAPDPSIVALALTALDVIRASNFQMPRLRMPGELCPSGWGSFDPRALPPGA